MGRECGHPYGYPHPQAIYLDIHTDIGADVRPCRITRATDSSTGVEIMLACILERYKFPLNKGVRFLLKMPYTEKIILVVEILLIEKRI